MRLRDRSAVVTGAASGIGRQVALRFAAEGARVAVADVDAEGARAVADEIARAGGVAAAAVMDVSVEAQVDAGIAEAAGRHGGVDILVSNAGVQHIAPLVELAWADWRRVLAVHL